MARWSWDDARVFLAVARAGSTSAAGRALRLAQTTCARRIDALEQGLGLRLFERTTGGFRLTEEGRQLLPAAEAMGAGAEQFDRLAAQAMRGVHSAFRVSAPDLLADEVLQPALASFRAKWPDVRIDLSIEARLVDVGAGEADFAIRADFAPTDPALVARKLGPNPVAAYCTAGYAARFGAPNNIRELVERPFAVLAGRMADGVAQAFPGARPRLVATSVATLAEAVSRGDLAAILPCLHVDGLPGLKRAFTIDADTGAVWLVYHRSLRGRPAVRDLVAAIVSSFEQWLATRPV